MRSDFSLKNYLYLKNHEQRGYTIKSKPRRCPIGSLARSFFGSDSAVVGKSCSHIPFALSFSPENFRLISAVLFICKITEKVKKTTDYGKDKQANPHSPQQQIVQPLFGVRRVSISFSRTELLVLLIARLNHLFLLSSHFSNILIF